MSAYIDYVPNFYQLKNSNTMSKFNPKNEPLFVKTGDKLIDSVIKFTIYFPYVVVILMHVILESILMTIAIFYKNPWLLILNILYVIIAFYIFVVTDFADKLFDKISHSYYYGDKKTYFQHQYEYTESLNKIEEEI